MITAVEQIESFIKGAVIGQLIGDAVGFPFSNWERIPNEVDMVEGPSGERPGAYQGPGSLSLCTMANIVEFNGLEVNDLLDKFHDFLIASYLGPGEDEVSDISPATVEALKRFSNALPPDMCGIQELEKNDNECLARILPIGLYYATDSIDIIIEKSHEACRVTHGHPRSQAACALYSLIVRNVILQKPEKVFELLEDYYCTKRMREFVAEIRYIKEWKKENRSTGGKTVEDCFWSAWDAHTQYERDFRFCVSAAVHYGNDANSTAAVAGGISALSNGLGDIPMRWLHTIALTPEVMETITAFTDKIVQKISRFCD